MPVLQVAEKLKQLTLPSTKDEPEQDRAWVVMDVSPAKAGDAYNVNEALAGRATFAMMLGRIREWNYTDEKGQPVPINTETLKRLNAHDFSWLQDQIEDGSEKSLTDDEKKVSSVTSPPSETAEASPATSP